MDYLYIFGIITILFVISVAVIIRLIFQINELKYELKLAKINCQKDLDRIEDKINQLSNKDSSYYLNEIEKLNKLQATLNRLVESKIESLELHNKD